MASLGAAQYSTQAQNIQAFQAVALTEVPDTAFNQICQTNCCECAESAEAAIAVQQKNRTFTINGSISVIEEVEYAERERAAEQSQGQSQKQVVCETNQASNGGLGLGCASVNLCPQGVGSSLGGALGSSTGLSATYAASA